MKDLLVWTVLISTAAFGLAMAEPSEARTIASIETIVFAFNEIA